MTRRRTLAEWRALAEAEEAVQPVYQAEWMKDLGRYQRAIDDIYNQMADAARMFAAPSKEEKADEPSK